MTTLKRKQLFEAPVLSSLLVGEKGVRLVLLSLAFCYQKPPYPTVQKARDKFGQISKDKL